MTRRKRRNQSQGQSGDLCPEGRLDAGRTGAAIRCSSKPDYGLEDATAGALVGRLWRKAGQGNRAGQPDNAGQDWLDDAGERFFRKGAHQGGCAERKKMIDRNHDLPVVHQCQILELARSTAYYTPKPTSLEDQALMRRMEDLHLDFPFEDGRSPSLNSF